MLVKALAFLGLSGSAAAAAAAAPPRQPTAAWTVDFHASQCVAFRAYGTPDDPLHLVLKRPPLGDVMQVTVMRRGSAAAPAQVEATITVDDRPAVKANMLMFGAKDEKLRVYRLNMTSASFAAVKEGKRLSIRSNGLNETFALSSMAPLLKVMEDCIVDLRRVWNITDTTGEQSTLPRRAAGNLVKVFSSLDYPGVALDRGQSGIVSFTLLVNEEGRVADCTVMDTSGVASLDSQTCAVISSRARFTAAMGADGKPAKDVHRGRVNWVR
jgi:TonB family protein